MGGFEAGALASVEPSLRYHPDRAVVLTWARDPGRGQCQVGSLTGAVASQTVTEAFKGLLSVVGNHTVSAKAKCRLDCESYETSREETRI